MKLTKVFYLLVICILLFSITASAQDTPFIEQATDAQVKKAQGYFKASAARQERVCTDSFVKAP